MRHGLRRFALLAAVTTALGTIAGLPASADTSQTPVLTSMSWAQSNVDATVGANGGTLATNTVTLTIEYPGLSAEPDDGVLTVGLQSPTPGVFLTGQQVFDFGSAQIVSTSTQQTANGPVNTTTYAFPFTLPPWANTTTPTWAVTSLTEPGAGGTQLTMNEAQLAAFANSFTSTSLPDPGPAVSSVTTNQPVIFGRPTGARLAVNLMTTVAQPFWTTSVFDFTGPNGAFTVTEGGGTNINAFSNQEPANKAVGFNLALPKGEPDGTYTLTEVDLSDPVGGTKAITGLSDSFTLTNDDQLVASDFALSQNNLNNWQSPQTVDLIMNVTSPTPVTAATVVMLPAGDCTAGTPIDGNGIVSIPITVGEAVQTCVINGVSLTDSGGDVSLYGEAFGETSTLPTYSALTGPAPTVSDVSIDTSSLAFHAGGVAHVTMDIGSWAPGVTSVVVGDASGSNNIGSLTLNRQLSGTVTVPVTFPTGATPGLHELTITAKDAAGKQTGVSGDVAVQIGPPGDGSFTVINDDGSFRLLDTRTNNQPLGAGGQTTINITAGRQGVPADATAVVLNVTATGPTASTFLTVWPDGQPRPGTSNLNVVAGQTLANEVTVPVGTGDGVDIYNHSGSTQVVVDLLGYYAPGAGSLYQQLAPTRLVDGSETLKPGQQFAVDAASIAPPDTTALVVNITVPNATANGFLATSTQGLGAPGTSTVNFAPGQTVANEAVVELGFGSAFFLYNSAGNNSPIVDVVGAYVTDVDSPTGSVYVPMTPVRAVDTRTNNQPLGTNTTVTETLAGTNGVPSNATALQLNATLTDPTANTFLTIWPGGQTRPGTSSVNVNAGGTAANAATADVGTSGGVNFYNHNGTVDLIVDLNGYFIS